MRSARARWALLATTALTVVATALFLAASISADTGSSLAGSPFNGGDGKLDTSFPSGVPTPTVFNDVASGKNDNAFGQGTKEDDTVVQVVTGSIPPNKNDLTQFGIDVGTATVSNVIHTYLYLDWFRAVNAGSANLDFEFNQNRFDIPLVATANVPLNRAPGDLLVLYDFGGSGSPVISISHWIASGSCAVGSDTAPCWGPIQTLGANAAEGSVSSDGLFGEAVIDLTAAGIIGPTQCFAAQQAWAKARSSTSLKAEMKDFISPGPINLSTCQPDSINVHKRDTSSTPVPLDGAVFQLWRETSTPADTTLDSSDTLIGSCTSGNPTSGSGDCTFSNITVAGLYYVKETTAPTGYGLPSQPVQSVTVVIDNTGHTYDVTFNDPPLYKLIVFTCTQQGKPVVGNVSLSVNGQATTLATKDTDAVTSSTSTPSIADQVCAVSYTSGANFQNLGANTFNALTEDPKP
ncbi:MAG TPA: prealbumin-like fold domain-containing protein [Chloroflexota bacterium]